MSTKARVTMDNFITVYQASNSNEEVAEALGLKLPSVIARANTYRKVHGLPLKTMTRKSIKIDVAAAKALIARLAGEQLVN